MIDVAQQLPEPLNTFVVDVPANTYYDFELPAGSEYPLAGVTYPVDYGHILGYTTEDNHELDLFVGYAADGLIGSIIVSRGENNPNEHKFFVGLTQEELQIILNELRLVLIGHHELSDVASLLKCIELYRDSTNV